MAVEDKYDIEKSGMVQKLRDCSNSELIGIVRAQTCLQTVGTYDNYSECGKDAKWQDDRGRPLCTNHKRQVDRVLKHRGLKCLAL